MNKNQEIPSFEDFEKFGQEISRQDDDIRNSLQSIGQYKHDLGKESYAYIPMSDLRSLYGVFKHVIYLKENFKRYDKDFEIDLIDIGAGTGRILLLAKFLGLKAAGLEYHEPYVKFGRELFGLTEEELIVGNAFNVSPEFLQKSRVIYTYMPLHNHTRMTELHFSMYLKAASSTRFIEMLPQYYPMNLAWKIREESGSNFEKNDFRFSVVTKIYDSSY